MKSSNTIRHAFTMIELIWVIVILGIVSSIGSEIIVQVYESYIVQRAQYRATTKTELALNQIANRLRYAIPGTVGFRATSGASFKNITEINTGNDKVLQWVSYDGDSFEAITSAANRKPGWSAVCDVTASSATTISTPGSNLALASTIITALGGSIGTANIYFPDGTSYGVNAVAGANITLDGAGIGAGNSIYERYKLAWTSYALSVEAGDLYLYYNFTPTTGTALGNNKSLLLNNVTNFRFRGSESSLRVKICKEEKIGAGATETVRACKEKVIF